MSSINPSISYLPDGQKSSADLTIKALALVFSTGTRGSWIKCDFMGHHDSVTRTSNLHARDLSTKVCNSRWPSGLGDVNSSIQTNVVVAIAFLGPRVLRRWYLWARKMYGDKVKDDAGDGGPRQTVEVFVSPTQDRHTYKSGSVRVLALMRDIIRT